MLAGPIVSCLSDQKTHVRAATIACLDRVCRATNLECMISSLSSALVPEQPILRKELLRWMSDKFESSYKPGQKVTEMASLVDPLLQCLQDKTSDVRKLSQNCLKFVVTTVGFNSIKSRSSEMFKGAQLSGIKPLLEAIQSEIVPAVLAPPSRPTTKKFAAPSEPASSEQAEVPAKTRPSSAASKLKSRVPSSANLKKDIANEAQFPSSSEPPFLTEDSRAKEVRADKNVGLAKWLFDTPRRELIEVLQEQCEGNLSTEMIKLLFSNDHYKEKDFLQALSILDDCLMNEAFCKEKFEIDQAVLVKRIVANSDLLLKYLSVRLYDTNTSMLLKCSDVIEHLVDTFDRESYTLSEYEASAFLPHFVNKAGDSKETIRVKIRGILKKLCRIYPASKLFGYLLEGVKSKNARTRTECLDELGLLIQRNGLSVCVAPSKTFPLIASQISDRDAPVRNAAMNAIVQAYLLVGENVYKYIGRLSEKDKSMLEERIKRQTSGSSADVRPSTPQASRVSGTPMKKRPASTVDTVKSQSVNTSTTNLTASETVFSLDLDKIGITGVQETAVEMEVRGSPAFAARVKPVSPPPVNSKEMLMIDYYISQINCFEPLGCIDAIRHLEKIVLEQPDVVGERVEDVVLASTLQIRSVCTSRDNRNTTSHRLCRNSMNLLAHIFGNAKLAASISQAPLQQCIGEVLMRIHDRALIDMDPYTPNNTLPPLSKSMSLLMMRILENVPKNDVFRFVFYSCRFFSWLCSILLDILEKASKKYESIQADKFDTHSKYMEVIMKCLWKMTKQISVLIADPSFKVSSLALDIHKFFVSTPPSEWKRRASENIIPQADLPFRSVKTILHELVLQLQEKVFDHIDLIHDPASSHAVNYMRILLDAERKKRGLEAYSDSRFPWLSSDSMKMRTGTTLSLSAKSTPISTRTSSPAKQPITQSGSQIEGELNDQLSIIFQKISTKELTKVGIQELFKFNQEYPYADHLVQAHIGKTGTYFQGYIRRGLANIAAEESEKSVAETPAPISQGAEVVEAPVAAADPYKDKLSRLQQMFQTKANENGSPRARPTSSLGMTGISALNVPSSLPKPGQPRGQIVSSPPVSPLALHCVHLTV